MFSTAVLVLATSLLSPERVSAWGAVGHHVVARIAWTRMTPAARDRASALLEGGGLPAFVAAATWADDVRNSRPETYNWHFVDVPVDARYDAARDCPSTEKGDCVILAIARERATLADATGPLVKRAEALKFLIHFVGDLHQPLHSTDNHDRGGNDVAVAALRGEDGRATNLHAVWDTGLINLSGETEASRADRLLAGLLAHPAKPGLDVVKWVEESHEAGVRVVYRYPGFVTTGPPADPVALSEDYRARARPVIDRQLQVAGARLGAMLNAILAGPP